MAATRQAYALDRNLGRLDAQASGFADAVEALGAAASAAVALLGPPANAWQVISALTGGRLLAPG